MIDIKKILDLIKEEGDYKRILYRGIVSEIKRHSSLGHLCGYIYIPTFAIEVDTYSLSVHGGITCESDDDNYNMIGFDCGHAGDLSPYMSYISAEVFSIFDDSEYRDMNYVENNIKEAIDQIHEMDPTLYEKTRDGKLDYLINNE